MVPLLIPSPGKITQAPSSHSPQILGSMSHIHRMCVFPEEIGSSPQTSKYKEWANTTDGTAVHLPLAIAAPITTGIAGQKFKARDSWFCHSQYRIQGVMHFQGPYQGGRRALAGRIRLKKDWNYYHLPRQLAQPSLHGCSLLCKSPFWKNALPSPSRPIMSWNIVEVLKFALQLLSK